MYLDTKPLGYLAENVSLSLLLLTQRGYINALVIGQSSVFSLFCYLGDSLGYPLLPRFSLVLCVESAEIVSELALTLGKLCREAS